MKRLPTLDQLEETSAEVSRQLGTLSPRDLEKVEASLEVAIWECERSAISELGQVATEDHGSYYRGALDALKAFHADVGLVRAALAKQAE